MLLKIDNLAKNFGTVEVLRNISFEIEKGDLLVLLGESGCGKSTLLNCIAGLEESTSGRIVINGRDVTDEEPSDRNIAMVFQSYALYPTMNVARNIGFSLECQGASKAERRKAVERVADILQITELLERKPSQLSGGQRQRVAMGRALVRDPVIFLLDEPMSNLDAKLRHQMRQELRELHGNLGATFILVTHDQIEAMSMATKVAVMDSGRIRQFGTPYDIYHKPGDKFVAEFVGLNKMNFLEGRLVRSEGDESVEFGKLRAPLDHYEFAGEKPADGLRVLLGIRPEDIYRSKERLEGSAFIEAQLRVQKQELTGGDVQVWFEFGGQSISCRVRSSRMPEIGDATTLYFDLRNASLFDASTGLRL
ncbi:MAG: ABC transporter ATP-binding protein [Albidovulum sp.]|nr:ABC transporter ATP-binding protein [Albidovulum sp.]